MTSVSTSPILLKRIDEFLIRSHPHLKHDDELYYLQEFTSGKLSNYSAANRLIYNYKKPLSHRNLPDWPYKKKAIHQAAADWKCSIAHTYDIHHRMQDAILVPIPPSQAKESAEYDARNLQLLEAFAPHDKIYELILQKHSRPSLRTSGTVRDPKSLAQNYDLPMIPLPPAKEIWLFDDVITTGATFRAVSNKIQQGYPNHKVVGFFIARAVHQAPALCADTPLHAHV